MLSRKTCRLRQLSILAAFAFISWSAFSATTPLVNYNDVWRYKKGNSAPQSDWKTTADASLSASWLQGMGGFGYSRNNSGETQLVATGLSDMYSTTGGGYTTVYTRKMFTPPGGLDTNDHLLLTVDWDDGFIAWLDGVYLASGNTANPPAEPLFGDVATGDHESSRGNSSSNPNPPRTYDLGPVGSRLSSGPHILAVMGLNDSRDSSDLILIADLDVGPSLATNIVWTLANSPYIVTNTLTIPDLATLTIEPGVVVRFNQGTSLIIQGRLLAEGTPESRITFTRNTGATSWSRIDFVGNPAESRIAYADISYAASDGNIRANGTRLYLDNIVFSNTTVQMVDVVNTSIILRNSYFPSIGISETVHFSSMPANGYALLEGNTFNPPVGYSDVIDFTGGNRQRGPIVQFLNNIFLAAVDDCFDMDGTDAHIEGNIFMNVKQDTARDSTANAISTGADGTNTSELVIVRNIFYNCDHALLLKDRGSAIFDNNTVVTIDTNPVASQPSAFMNFGEPHRGDVGGRGVLIDGNIVWNLNAPAFINYTSAVMFLTVNRSIIQNTNHPGTGNSSADPMFVNWQTGVTAENIRSNLALQTGSPAKGTGPNGLDMGAIVPSGASISGEPTSPTQSTDATLTVAGPGIYAFKWKLNDGPWSNEVPLTNSFLISASMLIPGSITLTNLPPGTHTVYVIGKNSAGAWQSTNSPAVSLSWTVQPSGDTDGDGAPDDWENANDFDPEDPNDMDDDADMDGLTNGDEYVAGTDPRNASSSLRAAASTAGGPFTVQFTAVEGKTYSVLYRDSLTEGSWQKLTDISAQPSTGPVEVPDNSPGAGPTRFYRVVTPSQ